MKALVLVALHCTPAGVSAARSCFAACTMHFDEDVATYRYPLAEVGGLTIEIDHHLASRCRYDDLDGTVEIDLRCDGLNLPARAYDWL